MAIAELKKVDSREVDLVLRDQGDIGARSGGCLPQKTSALHPGHEQHEERGAAVANEVRGTILRVKNRHSQNGSFRSHQIYESR